MEQETKTLVRSTLVEHKLETLINKSVICLPGVIDTRMSITLLMDLLHKRLNKKMGSDYGEPLWVFINSPGGSLTQGLAVYDTLVMATEAGMPVHTVAIGHVASMAVTILQAGTRRFSFPSTQFTIHQASQYVNGDEQQEVNELIESAKELERLNKLVLSIVANRIGMDLKDLLDISKKTDYSFDVQTALGLGTKGLVDEVITCLPFLKTT